MKKKETEKISRGVRNFFLGAAAFLLVGFIIHYGQYRKQYKIEESFSLLEQKVTFWESLEYDLDEFYSTISRRSDRIRASQVEAKINSLSEYDYDKLDELVSWVGKNPVKDYYNFYEYRCRRKVEIAAIKAIGRMAKKNKKAKDALCSLLENPLDSGGGNEWFARDSAAAELGKADPNLAFDVITSTKGGWPKTSLYHVLYDIGNERALRYFIKIEDGKWLADFVNKNYRKKFIEDYRNEIVSKLYDEIRCLNVFDDVYIVNPQKNLDMFVGSLIAPKKISYPDCFLGAL